MTSTATIPTLYSLCVAAVDPSSIKDEKIKIGILDRIDFWRENQKSREWRRYTIAAIRTAHYNFFQRSKFEAFAWDILLEPGELGYFDLQEWVDDNHTIDSIYVAICDYFGIPDSHLRKSREAMEILVGINNLSMISLRHEYFRAVLLYRLNLNDSYDITADRLTVQQEEEVRAAEERITQEDAVCLKVINEYDRFALDEDILTEYWTGRGFDTAESVVRYIAERFHYDYDYVVANDRTLNPVNAMMDRMHFDIMRDNL